VSSLGLVPFLPHLENILHVQASAAGFVNRVLFARDQDFSTCMRVGFLRVLVSAVSSVLKPLTLVFRPQILDTAYAEKCENAEEEKTTASGPYSRKLFGPLTKGLLRS
jgi:hypothetical protein